MKGTNAIAIGLILSSFALLGTWAGSTGKMTTTNTVLGMEPGGNNCPYMDESKGMGGQQGECTFVCEGGPTYLSVGADDPDAWASGSGFCNDEEVLHCSEQQSCNDETVTAGAGNGLCKGDTDEMWDSGIRVSCSSKADLDGDVGDPKTSFCPISIEPSPPYPRICVGASSGESAASALALPLNACLVQDRHGGVLCESGRAPEEIIEGIHNMSARILRGFQTDNESVSAHLYVGDGLATSLICWGFDCKQVLPTFEVTVEGRTGWSFA